MFSADDDKWMERAINNAKKAECQNEVPVGAVIVLNDELIAEGWNQVIGLNDPSAHAEIIAIRKAAKQINNYRLLNSTLYVTLEPCLMCVGTIVNARIKRVIFGCWDEKRGAIDSHLKLANQKFLNHQIDSLGGLRTEKCRLLLQTFFQSRRR